MRAWAAVLVWMLGYPAAADVVSPKPDAVALALYRGSHLSDVRRPGGGYGDDSGVAFVSETRTLTLPAGRTRVRFEGVAEGIIPQSAGVEGLPGALVERNYDYDLLGPAALLDHAVGQSVRVVRIAPRTGRETVSRAVIRSGADGVMLDFGGRLEALGCDGAPERLVFDTVPPDLTPTPTLSVVVRARIAGRYRVTLNYLAVRLDWSADYIARVQPDGGTLDLTGWLTLVNDGATRFADAPTAVVAGNLSRVPVERPEPATRTASRGCWPDQTTHSGWREAMQLREVVAARTMLSVPAPMMAAPLPPPPPPPPPPVIESALGDYHLYQLAEPTTLAANQTKQVMFLHAPDVPFDTVLVSAVAATGGGPRPAEVVLRLDDTPAGGLGRGLPAGHIQLRRRLADGEGRELLVGSTRLDRDVPVGEPFELTAGSDADVQVERVLTQNHLGPVQKPGFRRRYDQAFVVHVTNAKAEPVTVEIRHPRASPLDFQVTAESEPHGLKSGDPVWRFVVPAGGAHELGYAVTFRR